MILFSRIVFAACGAMGIVFLFPVLFSEKRFGDEHPPAITHAEFFYGFVGLALVFQFLFLLIAFDPVRFQPLMFFGIMEKLVFVTPVFLMHFVFSRPIPSPILFAAGVDSVQAILFAISFVGTLSQAKAE